MTVFGKPNEDATSAGSQSSATIWVVSLTEGDDLVGRLGDARDLADRCKARVVALSFDDSGKDTDAAAQSWVELGADHVEVLRPDTRSESGWVAAALDLWDTRPPRLVMTSADRQGRAWSAQLAALTGWALVSPALILQVKNNHFVVTRLDTTGRRAHQVELQDEQPAIVALRPGVAETMPPNSARRGTIRITPVHVESRGALLTAEHLAPDPLRADIRFLPKLIAGGRGLGGPEGFQVLGRIAAKVGAGVAASRMAVDLGWIEHARQVGQTGKTVRPELYIACGISGASHHLQGMSESRHIVAINSDPQAPLMQRAELAIQGDLHDVLMELDKLLERTT